MNRIPIIFIMITLKSSFLFSQNKIVFSKIDTSDISKKVKLEGKIKNAIRWKDNLGDNIILTTETGEYLSRLVKDSDYRDAELYAHHYINKAEKLIQTWKVYDFEKGCPLDIQARFIKNTLQVTDLNNNGVGEAWLMYKTVCHGDVSPSNMKIIMYEGQQKFAMRGQNKVKLSEADFEGGEFTFDKAFTSGPKTFRDFAIALWNKNIMETGD